MAKYVVRYGAMRLLSVMNSRGGAEFARGTKVIVRTNRGLEVGEVLCPANAVKEEELSSDQGQILREMSTQDTNELAHIESNAQKEFLICQRHVTELKMDMELVDIEHLFGGERVIVYYLAEGRVDFRQLVKRLASEFQTRIEMRQIGVRDEAKLLADYGDCGKPVCCNTHLREMPPVSMKMAKMQKATLDPTKISGRCGRLKCCLRYEYETYVELQRELPPVGSEIVTPGGRGRVLNHEVLSQRLLVEMEDHHCVMIDANDVVTVLSRGKGGSKGKSKGKRGSGKKKK